MTIQLPKPIATYVDAYNSRDLNAALACFSETAVVHDEGQDHRGRKAIGEWLRTTVEKYQPRLSAGKVEETEQETVLATTVSGLFPGSPVHLAFHFVIADDRIAELNIAP
jgi:hypothetical protein